MSDYDAIVVGAGPAGSVCAATLARSGRRVLLLDRARFPRDKVCGDCLNPSVWPVIDRLGLRQRLTALNAMPIEHVCYLGMNGESVTVPTPNTGDPEVAIKRRDFDAMLADRARELGADFRDGVAVSGVIRRWTVSTEAGSFSAPFLVAADGRNSTLARIVGWMPPPVRNRVALQVHCTRPDDHPGEVRMMFFPGGYGGIAPLNDREMNLCIVAPADGIDAVREQAERRFHLPADFRWRTISPLARADATTIANDGLFLVGDAARVVEPFTGEGIFYAMRSGELAAESILAGHDPERAYRREHRRMYRGRLWVNHLSRLAGTHPRATTLLLAAIRHFPAPLEFLTRRVLRGR